MRSPAPSSPAGLACALLAAVLAGCAAPVPLPPMQPLPPPPPMQAPPPRVEPAPSPLATEQRWLQQWFGGTPVTIVGHDDGAVQVDVPLTYAFDAGRATVKPPLAAVLDRVATSLLRQPTARLQVAAPSDASGAVALSVERVQSVREYLVGKGVKAFRITAPATPSTAAPVQLRLIPGAAPVSRLDDRSLPPPPSSLPSPPPAGPASPGVATPRAVR